MLGNNNHGELRASLQDRCDLCIRQMLEHLADEADIAVGYFRGGGIKRHEAHRRPAELDRVPLDEATHDVDADVRFESVDESRRDPKVTTANVDRSSRSCLGDQLPNKGYLRLPRRSASPRAGIKGLGLPPDAVRVDFGEHLLGGSRGVASTQRAKPRCSHLPSNRKWSRLPDDASESHQQIHSMGAIVTAEDVPSSVDARHATARPLNPGRVTSRPAEPEQVLVVMSTSVECPAPRTAR